MKKFVLILLTISIIVFVGCSKNNEKLIGEDEAKKIALSNAGYDTDEVTFIKSGLERDDGRKIYDVEFYTNDATEFDYEIDAVSGKIISADKDIENYMPTSDNSLQSDSIITEEDAKAAALEKVPGSTTDNIVEFKFDNDDGMKVYEGKIIYENYEYEFEINALTGDVISFEKEHIYD